jgi:phosphatidate phosphatase APP1
MRNKFLIRRLKRVPKVLPYVSCGTTARFEFSARVILTKRDSVVNLVGRGLSSFFVHQAPKVRLEVRVDNSDRTYTFEADRGGYVHGNIPTPLTPGWHNLTVRVLPNWSNLYDKKFTPVLVDQQVPDTQGRALILSQEGLAVITDVDDTILVSQVPTPLRAIFNILLKSPSRRKHVNGMPELFSSLKQRFENLTVFYLSATPWNMFNFTKRFIVSHKFPFGPILLQDIGPDEDKIFESTKAHKQETLEKLMSDFPEMKWILIGDDGQYDPDIYKRIAQLYPGRIKAILVRELSAPEHIMTGGLPFATAAHGGDAGVVTDYANSPAPSAEESGRIPILYAPDGFALKKLVEQYL